MVYIPQSPIQWVGAFGGVFGTSLFPLFATYFAFSNRDNGNAKLTSSPLGFANTGDDLFTPATIGLSFTWGMCFFMMLWTIIIQRPDGPEVGSPEALGSLGGLFGAGGKKSA